MGGFDNDTKVRKRARAAAAITLLAAAFAFLVAASSDAVIGGLSLRGLGVIGGSAGGGDELLDPSLNDIVVKMYVKASGNQPYLSQSLTIADTWGNDVVAMTGGKSTHTFLIDNVNSDKVDEMARNHPGQVVRHVNNTDHQGEYKTFRGGDWKEAYRAQRTKLRAAFEDAFSSSTASSSASASTANGASSAGENAADAAAEAEDEGGDFDWLCYMDDDMIVNVPRLWSELHDVRESCSPNCWIADTLYFQGTHPYAAGGWCMEHAVASRIWSLLSQHTDHEMRWNWGNDDVHFIQRLNDNMRDGTAMPTQGLVPQNSLNWYCHNSRPVDVSSVPSEQLPLVSKEEAGQVHVVEERAGRIIEKVNKKSNPYKDTKTYPPLEKDYNEKNGAFIDEWLPTLSVFHTRVNYDAYGIMRGKLKQQQTGNVKVEEKTKTS